MIRLPIYQVDAFADKPFSGNPAAIVPLEQWLPDELMQQIAQENNLSETAFFVREPAGSDCDFHIRWFTPGIEVPLCGHATLASAWVLFNRLDWQEPVIRLKSKSGPLGVRRLDDGWLELDFPNLPFKPTPTPEAVQQGIKGAPASAFRIDNDSNYMIVLDNEAAVRNLTPELAPLKTLRPGGLIVTAPGDTCDFVSRYFAPGDGIDEDPVTGSIHSVLAPYWGERLGKSKLQARQLSARGGTLKCELHGDRVHIAGQVVFYMEGTLHLADG